MTSPHESRWLVHGISGALCITLLAAGWWLGLRPVANQQNGVAELKAQVQSAESSVRQRSAEYERLKTQHHQVQLQVQNRPLDLRPASDLNTQIGRYSQLAEQCGLGLNATRVGDLTASGDHRYFPVTLGGSGPMVGVLHMLGQLHREHPDTAIQFIDMTRNDSGGGARFELKLVWLVTEAPTSTAGVSTGQE